MGNPAKKAAKYAKQTRNAARVAAVASVVSARDQRRFNQPEKVARPGWYPDPYDQRFITWWNGVQWVPESKCLPSEQPRT